jgi:hypothetical protein
MQAVTTATLQRARPASGLDPQRGGVMRSVAPRSPPRWLRHPRTSPPLPFGDSDAPPDCPVPGPPALVMAPSEGHDESQSHTTPVSWRGGGGRLALLFQEPVNCNPPFICSSTAQPLQLPAMVRLPSEFTHSTWAIRCSLFVGMVVLQGCQCLYSLNSINSIMHS